MIQTPWRQQRVKGRLVRGESGDTDKERIGMGTERQNCRCTWTGILGLSGQIGDAVGAFLKYPLENEIDIKPNLPTIYAAWIW
jgi:hypothetical protein